jgi:hypothetical protein
MDPVGLPLPDLESRGQYRSAFAFAQRHLLIAELSKIRTQPLRLSQALHYHTDTAWCGEIDTNGEIALAAGDAKHCFTNSHAEKASQPGLAYPRDG